MSDRYVLGDQVIQLSVPNGAIATVEVTAMESYWEQEAYVLDATQRRITPPLDAKGAKNVLAAGTYFLYPQYKQAPPDEGAGHPWLPYRAHQRQVLDADSSVEFRYDDGAVSPADWNDLVIKVLWH